MNDQIVIRIATPADALSIQQIYAPYVEETAVTFEYDVPDTAEFVRRITTTLARYPYLVAELNGEVVGYAYASAFRPRIAYVHSIETSIYVSRVHKGYGIGRALYEHLFALLTAQNVYNANACIAYCDEEDACLDHTSIRFHKRLGFKPCARFEKCGYKFDRWFDMVWMELFLAKHPDKPAPFIPFTELPQEKISALLGVKSVRAKLPLEKTLV